MEVHQEVIVECAKQVAKPPRSQAGYTGSNEEQTGGTVDWPPKI